MFPKKNCKNFWSNLDDRTKTVFKKWRFKLLKSKLLSTKGKNGIKIIPSVMIHDVHSENSSNVIVWSLPGFHYQAIIGVRNMEFGYIIPSKIQLFSPNISKASLKWSKESTLDDPWYSRHCFSNLKQRGSKFCLSGKMVL